MANFRVVWLLLAVVGCGTMFHSRTPREVTARIGPTASVVDGQNDFAWDLFRQVDAGEPSNVFLSPFSVASALSMTFAGAQGATAEEMAAVLHVTGDPSAWHAAFGALTRDLNGDLGRGYTLHIANRVWGQADWPWLEPFLDTCEVDYGAEIGLWDFQSDASGGQDAINDWVAEATQDHIPELLPAGALTPYTRMVLVNAIAFEATWATEFDVSATQDQAFDRADGTSVQVPMMRLDLNAIEDHHVGYAEADDFVVVRLPYQDDEVSMSLVLPRAEVPLDEVVAGMDDGTWRQASDSVQVRDFEVRVPKLEARWSNDLGLDLVDLGMPTALDELAADFSGMCDPLPDPLFIAKVQHEAWLQMDEAGTRAAAATAVVGDTTDTDSSEMPLVVVFNRPYLMVIQDDLTGAVLFIGRIEDPTAG